MSLGRRRPRRWSALCRGLRAGIRCRRRRFADRKADWLVHWVQAAPDTRLESVMGGPFRAVLVWQIFATMCARANAGREPELDAIIEFRIRRPACRTVDRYRVAMSNGRCKRTPRGEDAPTVALDMDPVSFLRLVGGAVGPAGLLLRGKLTIEGDVLLGARLPRLLNIPRRRRP